MVVNGDDRRFIIVLSTRVFLILLNHTQLDESLMNSRLEISKMKGFVLFVFADQGSPMHFDYASLLHTLHVHLSTDLIGSSKEFEVTRVTIILVIRSSFETTNSQSSVCLRLKHFTC